MWRFLQNISILPRFENKIYFCNQHDRLRRTQKRRRRLSCWLQKCILFSSQNKIVTFYKTMWTLQISVCHFDNLISCEFLPKLYNNDPYQNYDILKFRLNNRLLFTADFGTRKIITFSSYDVISIFWRHIFHLTLNKLQVIWYLPFNCLKKLLTKITPTNTLKVYV